MTGERTLEERVAAKPTVLPLALRENELVEEDFALLCRIAEAPSGPGRLRRPSSAIPSVKSACDCVQAGVDEPLR